MPSLLFGRIAALDAPGTKPAQALKDTGSRRRQGGGGRHRSHRQQGRGDGALDLFKTGMPELRAAAANGLWRLAPYHTQGDIVPVLLDALPRETGAVQREIVRAFSKLQDRRTRRPQKEFDRTVRALNGAQVAPEMIELRKALGIALDQFDGPHSNNKAGQFRNGHLTHRQAHMKGAPGASFPSRRLPCLHP